MQTLYDLNIVIKFILITENISFLPENILNCCKHIKYGRPARSTYNKCLKTNIKQNDEVNNITNIKDLKPIKLLNKNKKYKIENYKLICDKIIEKIIDYNSIKYICLRDLLYDICIFDLNINDCVWYIITALTKKNLIDTHKLTHILDDTYSFLKYYNNNYRPIYHLERYILNIIKVIYEL